MKIFNLVFTSLLLMILSQSVMASDLSYLLNSYQKNCPFVVTESSDDQALINDVYKIFNDIRNLSECQGQENQPNSQTLARLSDQLANELNGQLDSLVQNPLIESCSTYEEKYKIFFESALRKLELGYSIERSNTLFGALSHSVPRKLKILKR
jgi:hypothetical protein